MAKSHYIEYFIECNGNKTQNTNHICQTNSGNFSFEFILIWNRAKPNTMNDIFLSSFWLFQFLSLFVLFCSCFWSIEDAHKFMVRRFSFHSPGHDNGIAQKPRPHTDRKIENEKSSRMRMQRKASKRHKLNFSWMVFNCQKIHLYWKKRKEPMGPVTYCSLLLLLLFFALCMCLSQSHDDDFFLYFFSLFPFIRIINSKWCSHSTRSRYRSFI